MAKKIPEGLDSNAILNSFRPETPHFTQPTISTSTLKEVEIVEDNVKEVEIASAPKKKTTMRKKRGEDRSEYEKKYLHKIDITVRSCKLVNVRQDYHERIIKIVRVIGKDEVSLFEFIDNVLTEHFDKYENELTKLYNQNHEGIF